MLDHKPWLLGIKSIVQGPTLMNTISSNHETTSENQAHQDENIKMDVRQTVKCTEEFNWLSTW
jgi:hypothetical protein